VLNEIEGKVVIWGHWQKDMTQIINAIVKQYGEKSVVDYYGLTPKEDRQNNIKKFQTDSECRFFVGTPATGGYGIT
jgi:SNF2 family DNA or RNA helicase